MRITKLVATLWMASAAIFGVGVFLTAQSAIGPRDVVLGRGAEVDVAAQYRNAVKESMARKSHTQERVDATDPSLEVGRLLVEAKSRPHSADDAIGPAAMPLPARKEDGPEKWVEVAGTEAIMRPEPSEAAPMIVAFPVGRKLFVQRHGEGWTKVEEPRTATAGWIKDDQLSKPGELQMARLNEAEPDDPKEQASINPRTAPAESEASRSEDWTMKVENAARGAVRSDRPRPLGGLLRRVFGR